jgi:formylglycine-generating enzyme required for sulfatase activity
MLPNIDVTLPLKGSVKVLSTPEKAEEKITVPEGMALIPAGEFEMGSYDGESDEKPVHTVYLDAFYMDKYEVTNAQYARFLNEYGKNTDAAGSTLLNTNSEYCLIEKVGNTYRSKSGYENHPVVVVTWYGATAYTQFYGKRLPTEAEWEKAARSGLVGKKYPWGDSITHDDANYDGTDGRDKWDRSSPVGSFAPNGYGLYDMAGNASEWCSDWYASDYYAQSPKLNPQGPASGQARVCRGGSWNLYPDAMRAANRGGGLPWLSGSNQGFRCAQDLAAVSNPPLRHSKNDGQQRKENDGQQPKVRYNDYIKGRPR